MLTLLLALVTSSACGLPPLAAERPFEPGEQLHYDVSLGGLHAGEAVLALGEAAGGSGLESSLDVRQTSFGSNRFRARSRISAATLRPGPFRDVHEGWGPRRTTEARIDGSPNVVRIDWQVGERVGVNAYVRRPDVFDFASAIPYLRAALLAPGVPFCFEVVGATDYWRLEGRVEASQTVVTKAGHFQALQLAGSLRRVDGKGSPISLRLWITAERNRLPVAAEIDSPYGTVRAELVSVAQGGLVGPRR
jgi:hypothetical protein